MKCSDLSLSSIPCLDADRAAAFKRDGDVLTDKQKVATELSEQLMDELKKSSHVLIALPLYNLGISATLKGWID